MIRIRRIGVVKTATVAAVMYAVMTLIVSLVVLLPMAIIGISMVPDGGPAGLGAGVAGVLIFALAGAAIYAVIGWIVTAVACVLYNLVAGWVGGIELLVETTTPPGPYGGYPGYGAPVQYGALPVSYGTPGSLPPPPGIAG